ncbi:MAG TPA: hypothetical protein VK781_05890 [Solirubrobacteraceae bacterium]|nr:hypothetical protein [Solirubrobacteraceae bacterium]
MPPTSRPHSAGTAVRSALGSPRPRVLCLLALSLVGVWALSGCGSSKPAFCSHVSELEKSVQSLGSLNLQSGVSGVEASLQKVNADANAVVSSAKSEFPTQTAAIEKSVSSLDGTVKELSSATTTKAKLTAIASLAGQVSTAGTALSELSSAAKSKCS